MPMNEWKPQARRVTVVRVTSSDVTLHDSLHDKVHVLNATAQFIWAACDGRHTIDDIARELRATFDIPASLDLRDDITRILWRLEKRDLLNTRDH